jgi:hypothetical protein
MKRIRLLEHSPPRANFVLFELKPVSHIVLTIMHCAPI